MKRLVGMCAGSIALATGVALAPMTTVLAANSQSAVSTSHWASGQVTLAAPRQVNFEKVSGATHAVHQGPAPSFRNLIPRRTGAAQRPTAFASGQRASVRALPAPRAGVTPTIDLALMTYSEQVALYGGDQATWPPDTQVAAGSSDLVEVVNDSMSIWSKSGSPLGDKDLNFFFPVPVSSGYFFTDPRVLYDAASSRWFVSGWSVDANNDSQTYLAVSATSDPTGSWNVYTLESQSAAVTDQPMIGICNDKVVMAWNEFTGAAFNYSGAQALVLDKPALVAGTTPGNKLFSNSSQFRLVPAQSLGSETTTCYMAVNNASADLPGSTSTPTLGVMAITGTPAAGTTAMTETDLPVAVTNAPPAPQQPGGALEDATSNDDRLLSAVWQNGRLWTSATDACTPGGDTTVRNCMRIDEVNTSAMSVSQDFDLGTAGLDEYYPAVSVDSSGNLYVAYSASSSTLDPGAYAVISPASTDSFTAPTTIDAGAASYSACPTCNPALPNRWGDYSAAAPDPSNGMMWLAAEYAPSDAGSGDWGTAAAELSLPAGTPAITSAAQTTFTEGTAGTFTVTGTGSPALAESGAPSWVSFDSTTGVLSGTPATGIGGSYPIQITATNGVGSVTQSFTLTVDPPGPAFNPLGPVRVLDTRNGTGGISTPVGPNSFISLQLTGVAGVPLSGVTAVVLNVTVTGPTSAGYLTVYPDGTTRPTASNLNFTAGETIPNLVVVQVGADGKVDFYNPAGSVNVVADLTGYYGTLGGSQYTPVSPVRVLDTRNGTGGYNAPVGPNSAIFLHLTSIAGVPSSGVTAVVLNVTVTGPTSAGYLTVWPDGQTKPTASNLNFTAGETIPNLVVVPVIDGDVDFYNPAGSVNIVADLEGYYTAGGSQLNSVSPVRVLDTRNGTGGYNAPVGPNSFISLQLTGVAGVPLSGVTAVVLNVTVTGPTSAGYLTVYPDGTTRPTASNLNFTAGETIPNLVVVPVGADGKVDFYNPAGSVNLVADLAGYYTN